MRASRHPITPLLLLAAAAAEAARSSLSRARARSRWSAPRAAPRCSGWSKMERMEVERAGGPPPRFEVLRLSTLLQPRQSLPCALLPCGHAKAERGLLFL
eukprot:1247991-Rhodomonas_salina.2